MRTHVAQHLQRQARHLPALAQWGAGTCEAFDLWHALPGDRLSHTRGPALALASHPGRRSQNETMAGECPAGRPRTLWRKESCRDALPHHRSHAHAGGPPSTASISSSSGTGAFKHCVGATRSLITRHGSSATASAGALLPNKHGRRSRKSCSIFSSTKAKPVAP